MPCPMAWLGLPWPEEGLDQLQPPWLQGEQEALFLRELSLRGVPAVRKRSGVGERQLQEELGVRVR